MSRIFCLQTGLLFGNTVRDATGLLDASDFPNSQQFNEISTELIGSSKRGDPSTERAMPSMGRQIRFVGCVEIADEDELAKAACRSFRCEFSIE